MCIYKESNPFCFSNVFQYIHVNVSIYLSLCIYYYYYYFYFYLYMYICVYITKEAHYYLENSHFFRAFSAMRIYMFMSISRAFKYHINIVSLFIHFINLY